MTAPTTPMSAIGRQDRKAQPDGQQGQPATPQGQAQPDERQSQAQLEEQRGQPQPDGQSSGQPPPAPATLIGHELRLSAVEATIPHLATKAYLTEALQPIHKELAFVRGQLWVLIAVTLAALVPLYLRFLGWA